MAALERDARELALTHPERSAPAGHQKLTFALPVDGIGDLKPPSIPQLLITTDNVPDAPDTAGNTNPTIAVTGPGTTTPVVSTIDTLGDQDFYKVTLSAGTAYEFGLYSYAGGPNAVGLIDPYLELYGADGSTLVVSADGGADTVYNQVNSGFDVLLVYTPAASGTYYINARAFSNSPATTTGDSVGDYQLFAREQDPNDPSIYRPYYDPTEPLYAIDWGTQVNKINQTARNPDGNEGTRDTGNAQGMPTFGSGLDVPALAGAQGVDITGKNVITIYFAQAGDIFVSNDPTNPGLPPATITAVAVQGFERTAVLTSLAEFAKVADVVYLEVDNRDDADFIYTSYQGTPGPGISLLGSMSPPGESDEGLAQFNSGDERWNASDLAQGGFSFVTLIHEFGHGHGLAHPHDNGGRSGIMNGVEQETPTSVADYTTGEHDLNQGVFTMMSYEDGWQTSPYGNAETDAGYGYLGGLMAFDIAAIQDKYGVNEQWATGNDTYTLKDVNTAGTYYSSIWDGGGTDAIVYAGSRDTTIDLRAATLAYEPGGGGRVSFANGIFGGFTIANGVTIENAAGGDGDDTLTGNGAGNILNGGGGGDTLRGGLGDDTLIGGAGFDVAVFDDTAGSRSMWIFIDKVEVEGLDGTDTLFGIERMVFSDETYDLVRGFSPPLLAAGGFGAEAAAGGWSSNATTPRMLVDVTGDGALDVVGFGAGGVHVAAGAGNGGDPNGSVTGGFGAPLLASTWFGSDGAAGSWASNDTHPRTLADVNGDGAADLVGFGADGVHVALNIGGGTFAAPVVGIYGFGSSVASGGWTDNDTAPRLLADLNDDGRADILGFAESGTYVALASSDGTFGAPYLATFGYGSSAAAGGWTSDSTTPRRLADLNGDGYADLVGFAAAGVYASLGDGGGGFNAPFLATNGFGSSAGSGGWADTDARPRLLADLNGDGRDDILGFGADGTYGALANADGTFAAPYLAHGGFGSSAGSGSWASDNTTPRLLADLNGDGSPDLVGFGPDGVYAAYGDGSGSFGAPFLANAGFGSSAASGGWTNQDSDPRFVVDLDGGGIADIVGFGDIGVITAIGVSDWVLV